LWKPTTARTRAVDTGTPHTRPYENQALSKEITEILLTPCCFSEPLSIVDEDLSDEVETVDQVEVT